MSSSKRLTNEQIVVMLQKEFDDKLFKELYRRFKPLIRKEMESHYIPLFTKGDYFQEGRIALHRAIEYFDEKREVHFARYIQLVYKSHLYNIYRYENALKRGGKGKKSPLEIKKEENGKTIIANVLDYYGQTVFPSPEDCVIAREISTSYFTDLSLLERKVLACFFQGMKRDEIAQQLCISSKKVQAAYDRCRQKMRKLLQDETTS